MDVCLSTVSNYLSKWGFTAQKLYKKAQEQNPEQVKKWLEEEYPEIEKRSKKENASIFWGDESGLRSTHSAGKSYSPKGKTPEKKISAKRLSINMISAISNGGKLYFKTYTGKFVSGVFIDFMKRVIKQSKKKIFLIVDNLAVHKSAKVKTWVEENKSRIELFFLPPYSPEINPDELLNQDLKANIFKSKRPEDINDLKSILVNQPRICDEKKA